MVTSKTRPARAAFSLRWSRGAGNAPRRPGRRSISKMRFIGTQQQDAHEFLCSLLELVEEECQRHAPACPVDAAFASVIEHRLVCPQVRRRRCPRRSQALPATKAASWPTLARRTVAGVNAELTKCRIPPGPGLRCGDLAETVTRRLERLGPIELRPGSRCGA